MFICFIGVAYCHPSFTLNEKYLEMEICKLIINESMMEVLSLDQIHVKADCLYFGLPIFHHNNHVYINEIGSRRTIYI